MRLSGKGAATQAGPGSRSWPYTQCRRSVPAAAMQGSHASSVGHIRSDGTRCALSLLNGRGVRTDHAAARGYPRAIQAGSGSPSWPYTQWRRSVPAEAVQASHASSLAPTDLKQPLVPPPRWPLALLNDSCVRTDQAAATVRESYSGWLRLVKLAIHAMQTVDNSCDDAGIACQQLGAHTDLKQPRRASSRWPLALLHDSCVCTDHAAATDNEG